MTEADSTSPPSELKVLRWEWCDLHEGYDIPIFERIDGREDTSAALWAERLDHLIDAMEKDGVQFAGCDDIIHVYKDDDHEIVRLDR